ncbi:MAG: hypothetical protein IJ770_01655 [Alphaproteobacteria bacterium]|nr:hypothetical protein [Alphaproteobacteria bacterium]
MKTNLFFCWLILFLGITNTVRATHYEAVEYYEENAKSVADGEYKLVAYHPLTKDECNKVKNKIGLKSCPTEQDYLAGAALACNGIHNLPEDRYLKKLARRIYTKIRQEGNTTYFGTRNDKLMKKWHIYFDDAQIFYWTSRVIVSDDKFGYVRMFGIYGSVPYYMARDGKTYRDFISKNDEECVLSIKMENGGEPERFKETNIAVLKDKKAEKLVTLCYLGRKADASN